MNKLLSILTVASTLTGCALTQRLEVDTQTPPVDQPEPSVLAVNADKAIAAFATIDPGTLGVHAYAWMARAIGSRNGWDDPRIAHYLGEVYRQQNPDGGYGIEYAWDAFQDGSVNPADTSYAITLTDHVGPMLLEGYEAGVVEAGRVQQLVDLVVAFPQVPVEQGICFAYSTTPADGVWCVDNINASAAWFLTRAAGAGFTVPGLDAIVAGVVEYERSSMLDAWWPYYSYSPDSGQDWHHESTVVEAMMELAPDIGQPAAAALLAGAVPPLTSGSWEQLAVLRVLPYACGEAARPGLADDLASEFERNTTATSELANAADRLALTAYLAAHAAAACDDHPVTVAKVAERITQ